LRSTCDGILVGINTVLHDNPRLDVRLKDYVESGPKKIVLDTFLKIDEKCKLIEMYRKDLIIFTGKNIETSKKDKLLSMGISIYECNTNKKNFINIKEVLETLLGLNILRVLVEGGSTVHGAFLDNNEIDYAYFFIAPIIIGGHKAISSIDGEGVSLIKDAHILRNLHHQYFEDDFLIDGKLNDYSGYVLEQTDKISRLCSQV
jgi:diaminohydroxyphosphoribosylaminopyrimidine deaminase/5-amino-6-(5-phosphoribosylamino)uracil reductase